MALDSNFVISTKVIPDVSDVQNKLNQSSKSLKMNARLNLDISQFESQLKKINNSQTGNLFKLVGQSFKDVQYKGEKAVQVVQKFSDGLGHTKERIVYLKQVGDQFQVLGNELGKMTTKLEPFKESLTSITTETSKMYGTVNEGGNDIKATITTTTQSMQNANGEVKKLTTTVTEYTDAQGRAVKLTQQFDEKNNQIGTTVKELSKDETQLAHTTNKVAESNRTLGQSFTEVIKKVTKFYVATLPIQTFRKALNDSVEVVKEFDEAITELAKVSTLSGDSLQKYTEQLGELGKTVARTRTEMVESATEFKKAGFSEKDSATLAQLSALYQNTADEELSASEATAVLVSQMKAFNYTAEKAIHITDAINQVSQDFAVSSGDIGKGLTQAGASLQTYGNDFNQTIGLLTAGTEIFQGKSQQVARGLNQIANRVAKNEEALKKYDVSIKNSNGELRSTFDILTDLKPQWDKMSSAEQVALGTTLAGTNQYKIFSAVMSNFQTAIEATDEALNSENATARQNAVYMESLQAKTQSLKTEFESLVLGKGGLQDFAKTIVGLGTNALKLINILGGLPTILLAISGILLTININTIITKVSGLTSLIPKLIWTLKSLVTAVKIAYTNNISLSSSLQFVGISASSAQIALGALFGVLTIVATAYSAYTYAQKQAYEERKNEIDANKSAISSYQDIIDKLEKESVSREELNDIIQKHLSKHSEEISNIEDENEARQETINKLKEEIELRAQSTKNTGYTDYLDSSKRQNSSQRYGFRKTRSMNEEVDEIFKQGGMDFVNTSGFVGYSFEGTQQDYIDFLNSSIEKIQQLDSGTGKYSSTLTSLQNELTTVTNQQEEDNKVINDYEDALTTLGLKYDETTGQFVKLSDEEKAIIEEKKQYKKQLDEEAKAIEDLRDYYNITDEDIQKYIEEHGELEESEVVEAIASERAELEKLDNRLSDTKTKWEELRNTISTLSSSQDALKNAFKEINKENQLSIQVQQELIDNGYATALMFDEETGAVTLDKDAVIELTKAKYQDAIADAKLLQNDIQEKMKEDGIVAIQTAAGFYELAEAKAQAGLGSLEEANRQGTIDWDEYRKQQKVANEYLKTLNDSVAEQKILEEQLKNLETKGADAYGAVEEGAGKAGRATDTLKDKVSTLTKAYEKQIKVLKKQKEEAVKAIEEQIKALQKQKEEKIKDIESEIKSLQKQKEAREKYWKEQLDALEKENDERERNIGLQKKQEELAKAQQQRVMVFKDGQFQYGQDEDAVSKAQQSLQETEDKNSYERQKELIEELRDTELDWYEQRIQTLEDYKEQVEAYYDEQIEALEEYKEQVEAEYDEQIAYMEEFKENISEIYEAMSEDERQAFEEMLHNQEEFNTRSLALWESYKNNLGKLGLVFGGQPSASVNSSAKSTGDNKVSAYASGKGSLGDSELAVVGENPKYREIVIGSKLNNDQGVLMNLKRGSGVVNASATNTLASLFNSLSGSKATERSSNNATNINIGTINLPEVKDGNGFVEYLQNFSMDITQRAYGY